MHKCAYSCNGVENFTLYLNVCFLRQLHLIFWRTRMDGSPRIYAVSTLSFIVYLFIDYLSLSNTFLIVFITLPKFIIGSGGATPIMSLSLTIKHKLGLKSVSATTDFQFFLWIIFKNMLINVCSLLHDRTTFLMFYI